MVRYSIISVKPSIESPAFLHYFQLLKIPVLS